MGPNGSGKTTLLGCILEVLPLDSGSFLWLGGRFGRNYRRHIGAILETPNFYPYLNTDENLNIISEIKNVTPYKFNHLLDLIGLADRRKSKFKTYPLGMKQRLVIAATLIGDSDVLIFDKPTNGLDPSGVADVREPLLRMAGLGKTVIMSSHILDEVEKICSHVGIIKNGKLLAKCRVGEILGNETFMEIGSKDADSLAAFIETSN